MHSSFTLSWPQLLLGFVVSLVAGLKDAGAMTAKLTTLPVL